ncbi:MAG: diaminobutyrate acetyltransferase [Porticoccus sp.]|jgi:L-2,4-diaminobutyric acid acetyltransferase|uniref:diaminobutyrate acetyltransferase n=1 Tax=Porticoccus sp. TaxID=2024853 RepID=UPI00329A6EF9|tara:strand:- start:59630 stop:60139 length:510 start_codon:yes stop_codon:yes gene_type:complete
MGRKITLRPPTPEDGVRVHQLVAQCPPLDPNSIYCNLLQCTHFSGTSVAADIEGELVGFISGYRPPQQTSTLFIWQVAVGEKARGQGLASRMLVNILARDECKEVDHLETTITEDNQASWALFQGLADKLQAPLTQSPQFDRELHFAGQHDTEVLVRIGPFKQPVTTIA